MTDEQKKFDYLLDLISTTMNRMDSLESFPYDFGTGVKMYRTEIHTLSAIARDPGINLTRLAEVMGVTKGAASQTVSKLVKKGMLEKAHSSSNDKEIRLLLTELGKKADRGHTYMHRYMSTVVREVFAEKFEEKTANLLQVMQDMNRVFDHFERSMPEVMKKIEEL